MFTERLDTKLKLSGCGIALTYHGGHQPPLKNTPQPHPGTND